MALRSPLAPRLVSLLALVLLLLPVPATALEEVAARIDPLQPELDRDFTVVVTGTAERAVELVDLAFDVEPYYDRALTVTIREVDCPALPCGGSFSLPVPVDGDLPFEQNFAHALVVRDAADGGFLFARLFAVGSTYFHVLRPDLVVEPWPPTDNDAVRLLIPTEPNICGPGSPTLQRIARSSGLVRVFLEFHSGFGPPALGGPAAAAPRCTPAVPYLSALSVDLGQLPPGEVDVEVYLEAQEETLPIRALRRSFEVTDAPDVVLLQDGRFEVRTAWTDFEGASGPGRPVADPAEDSTLFTFFDQENWEVMAKVLDACGVNGHYWVFLAAATTVEYTVTVTDTVTGLDWTYTNPLGVQSPAVTDTSAFPCS